MQLKSTTFFSFLYQLKSFLLCFLLQWWVCDFLCWESVHKKKLKNGLRNFWLESDYTNILRWNISQHWPNEGVRLGHLDGHFALFDLVCLDLGSLFMNNDWWNPVKFLTIKNSWWLSSQINDSLWLHLEKGLKTISNCHCLLLQHKCSSLTKAE